MSRRCRGIYPPALTQVFFVQLHLCRNFFFGEPFTAPPASGRVLGSSVRSVQAGVTAKVKMKNVRGSALSTGWLGECFSRRGGGSVLEGG